MVLDRRSSLLDNGDYLDLLAASFMTSLALRLDRLTGNGDRVPVTMFKQITRTSKLPDNN